MQPTKIQTLNSFRSWCVVLTSALFFFYGFIQMHLLNSTSSEIIREFHFNAKQISQLHAFFPYGTALFLFPAGILLDRFSVRKLLLSAFTIAIIGTYVFSTASSFLAMGISRFAVGAAGAFTLLSAVKLTSRWFDQRHMALVLGIIVTIAMLGGTMAQTPLALLTESFGWRSALQIVAALGVFLVTMQFFVVHDEPKGLEKFDVDEHKRLQKFGFWHSLRITISNVQNWLCGIYISLVNLPLFILGGIWGVPYLTQAHNFTKIQAASIVSMIFIGMMIGAPLAGLISDRIGLRKKPMIIGASSSVAIMLAIIFAPTLPFWGEIILYLTLGLIISSHVLGYTVIAESNPHAITATAASLGSVLIMVGGMLAPVFGWLLELNGAPVNGIHSLADFTRANYFVLGAAVIALIAAILAKETYCKPAEKLPS